MRGQTNVKKIGKILQPFRHHAANHSYSNGYQDQSK
jgi:hypothetical protein